MPKKFKFKGLPTASYPYVKKMGKILKIRVKTKTGIIELLPKNPALGFKPNEIIDFPDDERSNRHHKKHPHFSEVL